MTARLTAASPRVELGPVTDAGDPAGYEAVVIGRAIHLGSWLSPTRAVSAQWNELSTTRVWMLSSGPLETATTCSRGRAALTGAAPARPLGALGDGIRA
jgi:hypothetical protein